MTVNNQKYLVPSSQVREIVKMNEIEIREVKKNRKVVNLRNEIYEFWRLSDILNQGSKPAAPSENDMILVCEFDGRKVAFCIDRIHGIQRVVQKTLSPEMQMCPGASGVTILGDGLPAVILDLRQITERYAPLLSEAAA